MSVGTTSKATRLAVLLAALAFSFVLAVLWLKTGRVPAASGGDEVWMGEGAYWLLKDGVHAYDFLADDHEHQVVSTFQPVAALFTALAFMIGGITPFTLMVQIPLVATIAMLLAAGVCRRMGLAWWISILVPCAALGLMMVERRLNQVRWEPMVAMWILLSFWFLLGAVRSDGLRKHLLQFGAGVSATLACITYYPHAPFALLALTGAAVFVAGWSPLICLPQRIAGFAIGGTLSGVLFLVWLLPNYSYFHKQVLSFGGEHYFQFENLLWPFRALLAPASMADWIALVEHLIVVSLALGIFWILKDARWRAAAWIALVMCGPVMLYRKPTMDVAGGIFGVIILAGLASQVTWRFPRLAGYAALWLLAAAAVGRFGLFGYSSYAQADRRSYAIFKERLHEALGPNHGKIASSQFTWIALREEKGRGEFNFIAKYGDPSYDYRSTALRTREGVETHSHIILAKGFDSLIREHYPEMQSALDDGTFVKQAEVEMPGPALPWSGAPIYECVIYRNTKVQ